MKLRTEISIPKANFEISHRDGILAMGSCFADCIGNKLLFNKFNILSNPFGTIFNPLSISDLLNKSLKQDYDFHTVHSQGIWQAYECHSELGNPNKDELLKNLKSQIDLTHNQLKDSNTLIVTLGTAIVYKEKNLNISVSNCHKVDSNSFEKIILTSYEIVESLGTTFQLLQTQNPSLRIILTVSPVRHIKDTLQLNALSKSILRVACHELESKFENVHYFPAYEIMMDDLRDYRFYKDDMIHPTDLAENHIWEQFLATYCNVETHSIIAQWNKLSKAMAHKPFFPESEAFQKHQVETSKKLEEFNKMLEMRLKKQ